jgi:TonB family protein
MLLLVCLAVGCAGATKHDTAQRFVSADAKGLRKMISKPLGTGGLYFSDPACERQFGRPGDVAATQLDAFAQCLAGLHLRLADRKDPLDDVVVLTYDPGIEIEARIIDQPRGTWLAWIGFESRRDLRDGLPTIGAATLESLRTAGQRDGAIDEATGTQLLAHATAHGKDHEWAWLKVCLDSSGKVTGAHIRETSSLAAAEAFKTSALAWTFKPLLVGGQPMPACSMVQMVYPAAKHADEQLPLPLPAGPEDEVELASSSLKRTAGEKLIVPDPDTKSRIHRAGLDQVSAAFQFCIDPAGAVASVEMLRSSGVPTYDQELTTGIEQWRYEPYREGNAAPVAVCSSAWFIYSQREGGPMRQRTL